ncbi:TRAP transporter large permease [Priestia megaterium]|nr:TRAP transporter large permease [Priestia megaterium]
MLTVLFLALFLLIMLGMDIAFVLMVSSVFVIGLTHFTGDISIPFEVVPQYLFGGVNVFSFTAIPLFILAGEIMNYGQITDRLVKFSQAMIGHFRGGVAQSGVVLNITMAGVSGSAVADCAATGSVMIPAMKKDGYSPEKSASVIASASTIGPVFPPSIPMIIIGSIAGISVGKLFLAGVIPGLLMGIALMIYIYLYARRNNMPRHEKASLKTRWSALKGALLSLGMPVLVLWTIISGVASPTESAAIAVLYALIVTMFVYKTITVRSLFQVLLHAAISTGSIMLTIAGGILFGWLATFLGIDEMIRNILSNFSDNKIVFLIAVNIILLILGMVLEAVPIILLIVPILFPLLGEMGIDPIHLSVIFVVNLMIGLITPPVGLHLFITASIAKVPMSRVIKTSFPFMIVLLIVLVFITFVPQLSLFLPNLMS